MNMEYLDVLRKLYYDRPHGKVKISLGLRRMERLLELLGNPQKSYRVVHITGTNGKGSVSRMVYGILKSSGENVGAFFSPHLYSFRERMEVNGKLIGEEEVVELFKKIEPALKEMDSMGPDWMPSFFETVTAMAFEHFRSKGVSWAVVEVGLGGRLDATNVVNPAVSVITTVDYDHMGILGSTLRDIAFEKAGIIKPGVPVVTGEVKREPLEVIERISRDMGSDLSMLERDFFYCDPRLSLNSNSFTYRGYRRVEGITIKMNGRHQIDNASVALRVLEVLDEFDENAVRKALKELVHPGRFETVEYSGKTVVLDGAHNPAGMGKLTLSMRDYFSDSEIVGVMGMLDDKDRESMVEKIHAILSKVYVTKPKSHRSESFQDVCDMFRARRVPCELEERPWTAFEKAVSDPADVVLVAGSLYLVGEIRMMLVEGRVVEEWNI